MRNFSILLLFTVFLVTACGQRLPVPATPAEMDETTESNTIPGPKPETQTPSEEPLENSSAPPEPTSTVVDQPTPTSTRPYHLPLPDEPIVGLEIYPVNSLEKLELVRLAGAHWLRVDTFHWDRIEPQNTQLDQYNWSSVGEQGLKFASEMGMQIIGVIKFTPAWAQKYLGYSCGPVAEGRLEDYGEFVNALVSRYSQPPYNIHYWELGNEPDIDRELVEPRSIYGCWGEITDPYYGGGYYGRMLKAVYPQIKSADPEAKVLVGGLALDCDPGNPPEIPPGSGQIKDCTPARFLEGILVEGAGDYFDGISFHGYDYYYGGEGASQFGNINWDAESSTTGPVFVKKAQFLKGLLSAYDYPGKFLMNTEVGLLCGGSGREDFCLDEKYQKAKADYLAQVNTLALAENLTANIWFSLGGWRGTSLVDKNLQPNQAYDAYRFSAEQLSQAEFVTELTQFPGIKGYEFNRDGAQLWVLWVYDGNNYLIQLESPPYVIYDVFGSPLPATQDLFVTDAPIYVEWAP